MAKNARKKKNNKNMIIGACAAVVVVVVIVLIVVFAANNGGINDSYFVSDDTKYVLTIESSDMDDGSDDESSEYEPEKTHLVYFYKDDEITGLKSYYEYADANAAKAAYDKLKDTEENNGTLELNGKYVVATMDSSDYEGMTASDVKSQIEFMESFKKMKENGGLESDDSNNSAEEE